METDNILNDLYIGDCSIGIMGQKDVEFKIDEPACTHKETKELLGQSREITLTGTVSPSFFTHLDNILVKKIMKQYNCSQQAAEALINERKKYIEGY